MKIKTLVFCSFLLLLAACATGKAVGQHVRQQPLAQVPAAYFDGGCATDCCDDCRIACGGHFACDHATCGCWCEVDGQLIPKDLQGSTQ